MISFFNWRRGGGKFEFDGERGEKFGENFNKKTRCEHWGVGSAFLRRFCEKFSARFCQNLQELVAKLVAALGAKFSAALGGKLSTKSHPNSREFFGKSRPNSRGFFAKILAAFCQNHAAKFEFGAKSIRRNLASAVIVAAASIFFAIAPTPAAAAPNTTATAANDTRGVLHGIEERVRILTNNYAPAIIHASGDVLGESVQNLRVAVLLDYKKRPFNPLDVLFARSDKVAFSANELAQIRSVIVATIGTTQISVQTADFDADAPILLVFAKSAACWVGLAFAFFLLLKVLFGRRRPAPTPAKSAVKEEYFADDDDEYIEINDFEELSRAADSVLLDILERAERGDLLLALRGSSEELTNRFLAIIDQREVGKFVRELENVGDPKLKDVLEAQGRVLNSLM